MASLDFEVIAALVSRLDRVVVAPHPVRESASFAFVLDVEAEIELRVFTVAGREVWRRRQSHDGRGHGVVIWDGFDPGRRPVANGVYLFTLTARPSAAGSTPQRRTGKLVVSRR